MAEGPHTKVADRMYDSLNDLLGILEGKGIRLGVDERAKVTTAFEAAHDWGMLRAVMPNRRATDQDQSVRDS